MKKTYKPFAKSVEDKPHTALGAAPLSKIADKKIEAVVTVVMDDYFTGKAYTLEEPVNTLHGLIKAIQGIIQMDFDKAFCNYHVITDLCIEIIEVENGVASVSIGS